MSDLIPFWVVAFIDDRQPIVILCHSRWDKIRGKRNKYEISYETWRKPEGACESPWVNSVSLVKSHDKEGALKTWKQQQTQK